MNMATKAIQSYEDTYPNGYNAETGITLYDHAEAYKSQLEINFSDYEGPEIHFTDGSIIDSDGTATSVTDRLHNDRLYGLREDCPCCT